MKKTIKGKIVEIKKGNYGFFTKRVGEITTIVIKGNYYDLPNLGTDVEVSWEEE